MLNSYCRNAEDMACNNTEQPNHLRSINTCDGPICLKFYSRLVVFCTVSDTVVVLIDNGGDRFCKRWILKSPRFKIVSDNHDGFDRRRGDECTAINTAGKALAPAATGENTSIPPHWTLSPDGWPQQPPVLRPARNVLSWSQARFNSSE
jgi:hypothetical protein